MATMSSEDMAAMSAGVNCVDKEIDFDLLLHHKTHYKVGVHALTTLEETNDMYKHMLEEYLTATAGKRFDPPLTFEAIPMFSDTLYKAVDDGDIDFVFANSGIFSCIGIEWGAQALATAIARLEVRGLIYDLDVYGGVIFTQADNFEINTIYDLKDRIIGAGSPSVLAGGQLEIYEMEKAGLSYVMDPKQMVFVFNQEKVVEGVLNGDFEVGFARTKMIESFVDPATGEPVDPKKFKVSNDTDWREFVARNITDSLYTRSLCFRSLDRGRRFSTMDRCSLSSTPLLSTPSGL